ncbi:nitrate reductase [candidate division KSB1 bacterium]|nr:MAG: nitrate reductase [candidate division KSB1 bacterium]
MTKFEEYFYRHLHILRRISQWAAVVLIFLIPFLNRHGINSLMGTFYSIRIGHLDLMDPALMFQTILLTKHISFSALLAGTLPLILALVLGRVFCSWICPYNLLAEYVATLRKKVFPHKKYVLNHNPKPHWYWAIFGLVITSLMVLGIPLITLTSFPGLLSSEAADLVLNGTIGVEIVLILVVILLEFIVAPRFWCKYACPVGATLALFHYKHTMHVHFDPKGCTCDSIKTLPCNSVCPLGLDPRHRDIYPYCYNCGECIYSCHKHQGKSLSFSFKDAPKKGVVAARANLKMNRTIKEVDA